MPLAKPARSPRTNYMPLQNLKKHPRTDYMPCNTCVSYYYLIIFKSSHRHAEHSPNTHYTALTSTTMAQPATMSKRLISTYINANGRFSLPPCRKGLALTSTTMGGPACHHVGKDLNTYINAHGRPNLPPCWKGSCVSVSSRLINSPWRESRFEEHQASL